ncbi:MAG: polysaccharide biosynthesis/export family protein [Candidatus Methylomirabilis sp.]|nr:polysaccharide biosynthesis/export family protein [Candidatus Methylomirabilis sp.]
MRRAYIYISLGILTAGCTSAGPTKETLMVMASISRSAESEGSVALNSRIIGTAAHDNSSTGDYTIGPGDLLVISVLDLSEVDKIKIRVGAEGFIRLPLIDIVRVKGLTARQLEGKLADLYGAGISLRSPSERLHRGVPQSACRRSGRGQ